MTVKRGATHKMALGLLNSLSLMDERTVPMALGGGVVCWSRYNRFELTHDGIVEFVAVGSRVGSAASDARRTMIEYLTLRGNGQVQVMTKACAWCGQRFVPTHPKKKYCSTEHKYKAQLARGRKHNQPAKLNI